MNLTRQEKQTTACMKLRAYWTERLSHLRAQNDGDLDMDKTQRQRGRIAAVKEFLALLAEPDEGATTPVAAAVGGDLPQIIGFEDATK